MSLTGSRRVAVALTSTALMGLSALALPGAAGAAEIDCDPADVTYSVSGGSIKWGVKTSFRSYLAGPIAHGGWNLDGTTFEGSERGADGQFVWPVTGGTVADGGVATANAEGTVRMHGHSDVLDTTLSNPTVVINGTEGELRLDYKAKDPEEFVPGTAYTWVEGTQGVAARFTLPSPEEFLQSGTVTIATGATALEEGFDAAFAGMYGPGNEMDPVTLVLDVTETCTDPGDGGEPGEEEPGEGNPGDGEPGDGEPGDGNGTIPGDDNGGGIFGSLGTILGYIGS